MKTAIKLILIDLVIAQIAAPILVMIPYTIYLLVTTGNLDKGILTQAIMIPAQLAGQVMMGIYLWKAGIIIACVSIYGKPVISVRKKLHGLPYQRAICHAAHWPFSRPDLQYPH